MKALTLWQPWASLIAIGAKQVETRVWSTAYRGELAIHAAAKSPPEWLGASRHSERFRNELRDVLCVRTCDIGPRIEMMPRGAVVCIVRLVEVRPTHLVAETLSDRELVFGNYEEGRYAWFFDSIQRLDTPIPAKGNRMLWNWTR